MDGNRRKGMFVRGFASLFLSLWCVDLLTYFLNGVSNGNKPWKENKLKWIYFESVVESSILMHLNDSS
jgi:hypothetical protein